MASLDLSRIRGDIEPFQGEMNEEFYQNFAGLKEEMNSAAIYEKHAHLFSKDSVATIQSVLEAGPSQEDERFLRYLRAFCTIGYIDNAVRTLSDRAATFQARSKVDFEGEKIPYRTVPVLLRNEKNGARRRLLFNAAITETHKLNEILLERMATMHDLAVDLGFRNYRDMCQMLKGIDYKALEEQMEEMLRRTERLYTERMDEFIGKKVSLSLSDAWSYDVQHAFRVEEYDSYFDKDKMVDSFFATLRGMGIEPERYPNIKVDMEERPGKSSRAFCAAIKVPDDIRLVIRPTGGCDDYSALFHEGGHSWHFGNTKEDHPPEFKYLGDNSVSETFAFLFDYLITNRLWLKDLLDMKDMEEYIQFSFLYKLHFLRRYAGKLIYELKLHHGKVSTEFQEVYRSCLQRALKFKHAEKRYLEDVDDGLYCAEYLRAWMLEAQLRSALVDEFGEEWFRNKKTGPYLKELWSYGQKFTADELVKTVGYVDLDVEPLVAEIERELSQ